MEIRLSDGAPVCTPIWSIINPNLIKMYQEVYANPKTRKVLIKALEVFEECYDTSLKVYLIHDLENPSGFHTSGYIHIKNELPYNRQLATFILTLTQAIHSPKIHKLSHQLSQEPLNPVEHDIRRLIKIEYDTLLSYASLAEIAGLSNPLKATKELKFDDYYAVSATADTWESDRQSCYNAHFPPLTTGDQKQAALKPSKVNRKSTPTAQESQSLKFDDGSEWIFSTDGLGVTL